MYSIWGIGWQTPTFIISFYVLAIALAIGHYVFFRYLDGQPLSETLPQSWVSSISTAFVVTFRSCLGAALGTAFTQRLWRLYRKRPMRLTTIDLLYTVLQNPLNLLRPSLIRNAKLEFIFALACWCIPIVTIFPPGGIRVISKAHATVKVFDVPTFNSTFIWPKPDPALSPGYQRLLNHTAVRQQGLFKLDDDGSFVSPIPQLASPIKQTLLRGRYLTIPSPCGANCSYSLSFQGPAFKCKDEGIKMPNSFDYMYSWINTSLDGSYDYVASENYGPGWPANSPKDYTSDIMAFSLGYSFNASSGTPRDYAGVRTINCTSMLAQYYVDVSFNNSIQSTKTRLEDFKLMNASTVSRRWAFISYQKLPVEDNMNQFDSDHHPEVFPGGHAALFMAAQSRAIRDSVVEPLIGDVRGFSSEKPNINKTMILETPWVPNSKEYSWNPLTVKSDPLNATITPALVEEMLINATLSTITLGYWKTQTNATVDNWINYYSFDRRIYVLAPYASALVVALAFLLIGADALVKNGVPAESGSFLQVACTTSGGGNETLEKTLAGGCLGGDENMMRAMNDQKFVYGELKTGDEGQGLVRRAGFGPVGEVKKMERGALYGVYENSET
ncbi:hypothetical protein BZA77DRAFT_67895 [Pyronema omphalodes]|nr:hypothetical protein BZA77DRAFT_67895 [Pyronema omphalodes]